MSRKSILSKNETNDSIRIVNLLLKVIDKCKNFFIFVSNFKDELEPALLYRCDMIFEMRSLSIKATYNILKRSFKI